MSIIRSDVANKASKLLGQLHIKVSRGKGLTTLGTASLDELIEMTEQLSAALKQLRSTTGERGN